jgi:hypothetical protein
MHLELRELSMPFHIVASTSQVVLVDYSEFKPALDFKLSLFSHFVGCSQRDNSRCLLCWDLHIIW